MRRSTHLQAEATRLIECDPEAIPALIEKGALTTIPGRESVRVTGESVSRFREKYVALSNLARDLSTSSRHLNQHCQQAHIPMLIVPRRSNESEIPFISRSDLHRLTGAAEAAAQP